MDMGPVRRRMVCLLTSNPILVPSYSVWRFDRGYNSERLADDRAWQRKGREANPGPPAGESNVISISRLVFYTPRSPPT